MATDERLGREIALQFDSNKVGNVVSADLSIDGETIEINNDDSGDWQETIQGRKNWTLSVTCHTDEHNSSSVQADVTTALIDNDGSGSISLGPESPTTGDVTYSGNVVVTNFSMSKSTDDVLESSFEFQGSGPITRNVAV